MIVKIKNSYYEIKKVNNKTKNQNAKLSSGKHNVGNIEIYVPTNKQEDSDMQGSNIVIGGDVGDVKASRGEYISKDNVLKYENVVFTSSVEMDEDEAYNKAVDTIREALEVTSVADVL